jgi:hypothetical protein
MNVFSTGAKLLGLALTMTAATFAWTGCDDDHDHDDGSHGHTDGGHGSPYPSCAAITGACHEVDIGDGPIHECHDKAHGADSDSVCAPLKDNCLKICGDARADGGTAEHDGGEEEEHDGH